MHLLPLFTIIAHGFVQEDMLLFSEHKVDDNCWRGDVSSTLDDEPDTGQKETTFVRFDNVFTSRLRSRLILLGFL